MAPRRGNLALRRGIGNRLRTLRTETGRTQESIAWACGIAKAMVSRIESGENLPSLPMLFLLAKELGVHAADMVAFDLREPRSKLIDAVRRAHTADVAAALLALDLEQEAGAPSAGRRRKS